MFNESHSAKKDNDEPAQLETNISILWGYPPLSPLTTRCLQLQDLLDEVDGSLPQKVSLFCSYVKKDERACHRFISSPVESFIRSHRP